MPLFRKKKALSKSVTIGYGLLGNRPNNKKIDKAIHKHMQDGYKLVNREEESVGCLVLLFSLGWARGKTHLTFVLNEQTITKS